MLALFEGKQANPHLLPLEKKMVIRTQIIVLLTLGCTPLASAQNLRAPTHGPAKWYDVTEWFSDSNADLGDEAIEKVPASERKVHPPNQYIDRDDDGEYEVMKQFLDGNADGKVDTVATYTDTNEDGTYDTVAYFSTLRGEAVGPDRILYQAMDMSKYSGSRSEVSGKVIDKNFVVKDTPLVEGVYKVRQSDGTEQLLTLGDDGGIQLFQGDRVTAWGPVVKIGDKAILVAVEYQMDGQEIRSVHHGRKYSGVVQSADDTTVAGENHMIGKVQTKDGKILTVDVPKSNRMSKFKPGQQVTISGVPVSVDDRTVLLAITVDFPQGQ